ncbi:MAG: TRAP transporter substrate-binding protein [Planctomycetota bacterium]|nr:TRAP transporter substrate-binding protein [Planctomycetota bacterium]
MKRRDFLRGAAAGAAAGGLASCGAGGEGADGGGGGPAVHTTKRVRWRCASSFPRSLDAMFGAAEVLALRVEEASDGNFRIRVHQGGEIVPPLEVLEAVQNGTVQLGQTASYYYIGKNPALAFDTCVPFGLSARQQTAWLLDGGGRELLAGLFADFNIRSFPAGNTGAQMGGWFRRQVDSAADLRGLRMRIPGLGGRVMDALGVVVQNIPAGDIYIALETGRIDATEWVGPYDDEKLGFHRVANNYYYPGWWEPGPSLSYHVNLDAWNALPSSYQAIFRAAAAESAGVMQTRYDMWNPPALQRIVDGGVEIRPFSEDLLKAAAEAATQLMEDEAAADATYRKIYAAWKKARGELFRWFGTAELSYARFAFK